MKNTAYGFWVLAVLSGLATLMFSADHWQVLPDGTTVHSVQFGEGLVRWGHALFALTFTSIICGCVFWVGHLLSRRP